jgi:hypothetical protein
MIVIVDYHTEQLGDAIAPEDHLALVSIGDHGATRPLIAGWKHVLEIEFADETRVDSPGAGMTDAQADVVIDFCLRLGNLSQPVALILRCDQGRRRSAAIAKALGEWCELWVEDPGLRYSRPTYRTMWRRIGTRASPTSARVGTQHLVGRMRAKSILRTIQTPSFESPTRQDDDGAQSP